jgi:hypothetical protein
MLRTVADLTTYPLPKRSTPEQPKAVTLKEELGCFVKVLCNGLTVRDGVNGHFASK